MGTEGEQILSVSYGLWNPGLKFLEDPGFQTSIPVTYPSDYQQQGKRLVLLYIFVQEQGTENTQDYKHACLKENQFQSNSCIGYYIANLIWAFK